MRIAGIILCSFMMMTVAQTQTQSELTIQSNETYKEADAALNKAYKEVTGSLTDKQKELLKQSQRAWLAYRDLCIESEGSVFEGGSIQPMVEARCATDLTKEKTNRLQQMTLARVARLKIELQSPAKEQAAFEESDKQLNKVYKAYMANIDDEKVRKAQSAWLTYRDLCAQAESALFEGDTAKAAALRCTAELTRARTERLKTLFVEGYEEEGEAESGPASPK